MRTRTTALLTALVLLVPLVADLPASATKTATSTAEQSDVRTEHPLYVKGEMLVRFAPSSSQAGRSDVRRRHGLDRIRDLPVPGLELVSFRGRGTPPQRAAQVNSEHAVRYAEPNFLYGPAATPGDDPAYPQLYGLHNTGQPTGYVPSAGTPDADIDAPEGWNLATGSRSVLVGVIDTGIDIAHEDLAATIAINGAEVGDPSDVNGDGVITIADLPSLTDQNGNGRLDPEDAVLQYSNGIDADDNAYVDDIAGWDFYNNDNTVFDPHQPDDHGTHVAGTIAGVDNAVGVIGVSNARIVPIKFLGPGFGSTDDAVDAIHYGMRRGVHLTNNSWGGSGESAALQDAIAAAGDDNQLFVAAAGNAGSDNDTTANYPSTFANSNIVSVAATDQDDALASFSNYGDETVDLGAPGVETYSTVPRFAKAVVHDGTYHSALHSIGLEGVTGQADREALVGALLSWAGITSSDPVLLVDDDLGADHEDVWISTLTSAAVGHPPGNITTYTVPTGGPAGRKNGPSAAEMDAHALTIWFTGSDFDTTLSDTDRSSISSYLVDSTDKLALFGIDIGFDLRGAGSDAVTFLRDVLKTDYVSDYDRNYQPSGVDGVPGYGAVPVLELEPGLSYPGQGYSDALNPRAGAVAGLRGAPYTWFSGTSMAAPHVAGAAAQVYGSFPGVSHADVKARLMDYGDPRSSLAGTTVSGKRLNLAGALSGADPDTTDPTVSMTSPSDGASLSGTVTVAAEASDDVAVSEVEFVVDGVVHATDTSSPYSWSWDSNTVDDGSYALTARAIDGSSNASTSSPVTVTVDNTAPAVSIISPPDGATVSGTVSVAASATDVLRVSEVEFLVDGVVKATDVSSPYEWSWDTTAWPNDSYTLTARTTDTSANLATSPPVSVTADNPEPTPSEPVEEVRLVKALGGTAVLSASVLDDVTALTGSTTTRIAGPDRYSTAAAIVADAFPGTVDTVYVATGADFPDALAGSAAAASVGAPVLLVARDSVPPAIATQLTRLSPKVVKVLGGPAAVSDATLRTIANLTGDEVHRVAGADRYATAAEVVADAFPGPVPTVYVATGANFPDALAGSAAAAELGAPIVLVAQDSVPEAAADRLRRMAPSRVKVLGGPAAVSDATMREIASLTGATTQRLAGPDRYATAAAIVADAFPGAATVVYVAVGSTFPDALAGSAAAADVGAPALLATHDGVPDAIATELKRLLVRRGEP